MSVPIHPDWLLERATDSGLRVRVFTPEVATQDPLPVGVYGGWASGNIEAEEATCIHVAVQVPSIIIAVAYRLAPEFKAPAAHNDAVDALIWAWKNVSGLGGDQTRLFTIGGSAGGNLAISVVLKTLDQEINVTGIVAIVPVTVHPDGVPSKHRSAYKSYAESVATPVINKTTMDIFFGTYNALSIRPALVDILLENYGAAPTDPSISLLCNPRIGELPPTYLVSCTADPLRDDARLFKQELDNHKVPNKITEYEGMPHYFWIFPQLKQRAQFLDDLVNGIWFILGQ
ncbi:uncharacterized protein N7458_005850 [Penicillium daleae]|uniref:Alpha/beta hydrolase fold-3 domain-containing protein n=1 Tax=Penicillium daleae TaxID=63821 RepID=A0AAD6CB57_9EURO|nr:uncharacterized protein N7458_005850 [Penicillium daleae]KAJ5454894.1 hypothetical protein N7458_005850 [Penicillium daleae]